MSLVGGLPRTFPGKNLDRRRENLWLQRTLRTFDLNYFVKTRKQPDLKAPQIERGHGGT